MFSFYIFVLTLVLIIIVSVLCCYLFQEHRTIPVNGGETTLNIPQHLNHGQHVQTGLENTRDENEGRMINSTASDAIHDENEDCEESSSDEFETDNGEVMREINSVRRFVDEQKLLSNMKEHHALNGMIKYINDNLHNFKEKVMEVAIIGRSGAGKSSLINALRGLAPTDDGGAAVGETETTSEINKYTYPANDKVILLDVPGMDTWRFPIKEYLEQINYKTIDVFIIVVSVRIYDTDIVVLKKLTDYKKHVMVVRSKIDMDMQNAKRNYPKDFNENGVLYRLKQDLKSNISKVIPEFDNLFLISAVLTKEYDFPYLTKTLRRFLNKKGTLISKLIYNLVKTNIQKEKLICQTSSSFVFDRLFGFVCMLLPEAVTVYLINTKVAEIHKTCLETFCLDKYSLEDTEVQTLLKTQGINKKLEECSLE